MTDRRGAPGDPVADLPIEDIVEIQGDAPPAEQDAVISPDEMEGARTPTRTELDQGDPINDPRLLEGDVASLDGLDLDRLREDETDDPGVASQEGIPYVPPTDPPVRSDSDVDVEDHRAIDDAEPELAARIREALRADAATTGYADRLIVGTRGPIAVVRGVIDDVDDGDSIVEVISRVSGVDEVVDQTELA
jgi:hypothetical protein